MPAAIKRTGVGYAHDATTRAVVYPNTNPSHTVRVDATAVTTGTRFGCTYIPG